MTLNSSHKKTIIYALINQTTSSRQEALWLLYRDQLQCLWTHTESVANDFNKPDFLGHFSITAGYTSSIFTFLIMRCMCIAIRDQGARIKEQLFRDSLLDAYCLHGHIIILMTAEYLPSNGIRRKVFQSLSKI